MSHKNWSSLWARSESGSIFNNFSYRMVQVYLTFLSMPWMWEATSSSMEWSKREWYAFLAPNSSSEDLVHETSISTPYAFGPFFRASFTKRASLSQGCMVQSTTAFWLNQSHKGPHAILIIPTLVLCILLVESCCWMLRVLTIKKAKW